jgi:hypothetical protein
MDEIRLKGREARMRGERVDKLRELGRVKVKSNVG